MKRLLLLPFLLLFSLSTFAQSTTVSGQVTDSGGQSWNNGTITAVFVVNPQYPTQPQYTWTGGVLSPQISSTLTATGSYSMSVPSNTAITPVNSQWRFQVCSQATFPCFYTSPTTITGATQTVNVTPPTILINLQATNPPVSAYTDSEVTGAAIGSTYYNLSGVGAKTCTAVSGNTCTTWNATNGINSQNGGGPAFNPKGYGAVGDTSFVSDGVTQGSSGHTVTSATAHFQTNAKVGQKIVCAANGNSTPLMGISTITAITSDMVVTTNGTDAGAASNLSCIWYTQDDTAAFCCGAGSATAAAIAAGTQNVPIAGGPVIGRPSGTVSCPAGGYAVSGRVFHFAGNGSTIAPKFIGEGRDKCIFYMIPGITDPNDGFAILMDTYASSSAEMSGFSVEGLKFGSNFNHPIVQFNTVVGFRMQDVSITNASINGTTLGTLSFKGSSSGYVSNVQSHGDNGVSHDFACEFNGTVSVEFHDIACSNHNQNGLFNANGSSGTIRTVFGDNLPTFFNPIFDECGSASADCYVFQNGGGANIIGGWIGVGSGGRSAMNIDGTSQVWLSNVNCGIFGSTTNNSNCANIASGGFLEATGSTLRSNGASGVIVTGPAGATFVDAGGNKYLNCVSAVCSAVTPANYGTVGFTGGIVPKATVTHTPNTVLAVQGNLLATAQNLATFINDQNYQLINITAQSGGTTPANSSCATPPVITFSDGTRTSTMTMTSGQTFWCSQNVASCTASSVTNIPQIFATGTALTISIGANTCATPPSNVSVSYVLQSVLNP